MLKVQYYILVVILLVLAGYKSYAQEATHIISSTPVSIAAPSVDSFLLANHLDDVADSSFVIRKIIIEGNKTTRRIIMLRELAFHEGDTIKRSAVPDLFRDGRNLLMNTQLFHNVNISVIGLEAPYVDIQIVVKERWYILPFVYFKPVDRNLSQWLFEEKASFSRVDYGAKLLWSNFTGNNDKLNFYFVTGYTKQLMVNYRRPYIDKDLKWGMNLDFAIGKNREINFNTIDDKQAFFKDTASYIKDFSRTNIEFTYRKAFYTSHTFGVSYNTLNVKDTILKLNPNFFSNGKTSVRYPSIYYKLAYVNLDYIPYPKQGYAGELFFIKQGFDKNMNLWQLIAKGMGSWPIGKSSFWNVKALGTVKLPFKQPYFNTQVLGYGDLFLKGYEYYVIDGVAGGLISTSATQQLTNFSFHIPYTEWLTPRQIPLKIYGKVFGNMGYVYRHPDRGANTLPNKMLFGGGVGLDLFTSYDLIISLEFSFNQLGQNGLYLHKKGLF